MDLFRLDMAQCMVDRDFEKTYIKLSWADSSPHGNWDFFVWRVMLVEAANIVRVHEALKTLTCTTGGSQAKNDNVYEDEDDAPTMSLTLRRQGAAANKILTDCVAARICVAIWNLYFVFVFVLFVFCLFVG